MCSFYIDLLNVDFLGPPKFEATKIWNEIVADLRVQVPGKRRRVSKSVYDHCVTGTDVVDAVLRYLMTHETHFDQAHVTREKATKVSVQYNLCLYLRIFVMYIYYIYTCIM